MEPFLGEIQLFAFPYAPQGWALCNGQILSINTNVALYALLGTKYGGNGQTTFALPNLNGRVPMNPLQATNVGIYGGGESVSLSISEIPSHTHQVIGSSSATPTSKTPAGQLWCVSNGTPRYASSSNGAVLDASSISVTGQSAQHSNMQPYIVGNYCIAIQGIFPSRP